MPGPEHRPGGEASSDTEAESAAPQPRPVSRSMGRVRRAPKPKMSGLLDSPSRNLTFGIAYILTVTVGVTAYMACGWSFRDALYMVITTVYTVGYEEVRPIDSLPLYITTISLIVSGCTGIIFLTGVMVQLITVSQLNRVMGHRRMQTQIDHLSDHVIVCGYGRIGVVLGRALAASSAGFVILEQNEERAAAAREEGCLCIQGDATLEATLHAAGVTRARVLATVLPNDAVNVFITLRPARSTPICRSSREASCRAPKASCCRPGRPKWCCRRRSAPTASPS
jgi:voltage-gated potassium channel